MIQVFWGAECTYDSQWHTAPISLASKAIEFVTTIPGDKGQVLIYMTANAGTPE